MTAPKARGAPTDRGSGSLGQRWAMWHTGLCPANRPLMHVAPSLTWEKTKKLLECSSETRLMTVTDRVGDLAYGHPLAPQ